MVTKRPNNFRLPRAPNTITKGKSLKLLLDYESVDCLAHNLSAVYADFDKKGFKERAQHALPSLELLQRGNCLAELLYGFLPKPYSKAIEILLSSLTPPLQSTEQNGLGVFFYLPHVCFVASYGLSPDYNRGKDSFETSMYAQYELTRRFSAEFSIRHFLIQQPDRTLRQLNAWCTDPCPHVRRLCSEGTRPRLPWAIRIPAFVKDPSPCLPILERLRDDPSLYVRRSVANHLGDIAKDHRGLIFALMESWLKDASAERKWLIRHALRYWAKKGDREALRLRELAA